MEVELILKADNTQYVKGIKDAQKATQELHTTADAGAKKQQESIEDLTKEYDKLWKEAGKGFSSVKALTDYAKRTEEIKKKIIELTAEEKRATAEQEKLDKSTKEITQSISKWALSLGGVIAIFKLLKDAILQTTIGINAFNIASAAMKQIMNDIVTGQGINLRNIQNSIVVQKEYNKLRFDEKVSTLKAAKAQQEYNKYYFEASDRRKTDIKRIESLDLALDAHNRMIDEEMGTVKKQIELNKELRKTQPDNDALVLQYLDLNTKLIQLEGQRYSDTKRIEMLRTGLLQEQIENRNKLTEKWFDEIEEQNKKYDKALKERLQIEEEFNKLSLKLIDDYTKSNIESLTGEAKLKAQREFGIKQIKEFRDQLAELGTITDEQMVLFEKMGENVWKIYYDGIAKQAKPTAAQKEAITKSLLAGLPTLEGLQKSYIRTIEDVSPLDKEFSLWNIIGLDPGDEEEQEIIDAIKETAGKVGDVLDDIFQRRVDDAQRTRELLDIRIAETQRSLELEMDLLEEGYANNVDAKKREVEALKKQREAALKAEEKAIKQEQLLAKISQTTNILSGVSDIIKIYSKIPIVGLILAAAAIASLFAIWGKAKSSASSVTFAEGASGTEKGIITGKSHAAGGERFLDHVEVERGEAFGVLSRKATDKYGKVFHNMVSSFNRDEMPDIMTSAPIVNNPVTVENSGPNSRMDKMIIEQRKLNDQFSRQTQISTSGNKRIIKQGNKIRIIG